MPPMVPSMVPPMDPYARSHYGPVYTSSHVPVGYQGGNARPARSRLSDNILVDNRGSFVSNPDLTMIMRQEPKEALVLSTGKEKGRKPVDPPPIIQLTVNSEVESSHHFLQSPYLFLVVDLWKSDKDERWDGGDGAGSLYGGLCSSLHRLKDVDNKDGGFFIFGDISVKVTGTFRLHFKLYDLQKEVNAAVFLGSITSAPFKVMQPKDFQGLEESTYLSRAFSDQGVRLRLRKEPRVFAGQKRGYYSSEGIASSEPNADPGPSGPFFGDKFPAKRHHADTEDPKESYSRQPVATTHASLSSSSYPPTLQANYSESNYTPTIPPTNYMPYPTIPQSNYSSSGASYAAMSQSNYNSSYFPTAPYQQTRSPAETRPYNVGPYGSMHVANVQQSIPQSITQSVPQSISQSMSQSVPQPVQPHYHSDLRSEANWDPMNLPAFSAAGH